MSLTRERAQPKIMTMSEQDSTALKVEQTPPEALENVQIENGFIEKVAPNPTNVLEVRKNKKEFRIFLKLIKSGKLTTAIMASKVVGVSRQTIGKWLQTKSAKALLDQELDDRLSTISKSKDWKAHAYIIDKITEEDKNTDKASVDLKQLIYINTS